MTNDPTLQKARQFMRDWLNDCEIPYDKQDSFYGVTDALAHFEAAVRADEASRIDAAYKERNL